MGLGYYQLCLVGRYRSRRNVDLSCTFVIPSEMENGSKPFCRSDDHIFGCSSGVISNYSHGSSLVGLFGSPNSKPVRFIMGELYLSIVMGRFCDLYLSFCFFGVLVDWIIA